MAIRSSIPAWIVVIPCWYVMDCDHTPWVLAVGMGTWPCLMYLFSAICYVWGFIVCWGDPEYRRFVATGGDPYFDLTLPWPINTDSWSVRAGGRPEPKTDFVPPHEWTAQCPHCGARNEQGQDTCWNCGGVLIIHADAGGRTLTCCNCLNNLVEMNYGDLENGGVNCPHCGTLLGPVENPNA
jgi:hypothetical protein